MTPPRRGRPLGAISIAVLDLVHATPLPIPSIAGRLQLSYGRAAQTVVRLQAAGYVRYGEPVFVRGDRPARVVQPSSAPAATVQDAFASLSRALTRSGE